ncbi:hypothetical protein YC2023_122799 [Brassica napus]
MEDGDNQYYGGGSDKKFKRGKNKSKVENAPTNTVRLTSGDPNYPPDVRGAKHYSRDWRESQGAVKKVTDQGKKDTCWVHSTNKSIEAKVKILFDLDISLSDRHLYDGIDKKRAEGAVRNFEEIRTFLKNEGVIRKDDCECAKRTDKKDPCTRKIMREEVPVLKIDELVTIKEVNEEELIKLVDIAPVVVSIEVTKQLRTHKGEGIYYGPKTSKKTKGDHVVLLIGYNSLNGEHYWIIQNSWGTTWGDGGFAKISRACSRVGCQNQSLFSTVVYPVFMASSDMYLVCRHSNNYYVFSKTEYGFTVKRKWNIVKVYSE